MKVIEVSAQKGGVGTSTVAVSLAVALSKANPTGVLLVDTSTHADTWAIAGLSVPASELHTTLGEHELAFRRATVEGLADLAPFHNREFVVIDAGTSPRSEYFGQTPFRVSVVTNSYLSLRAETFRKGERDAVVCVHNSDFVLTTGDVKNVLSAPLVHYFAVDSAVARAIDAGLYADARANLFAGWTSDFLRDHGLATPATV